MPKNTQAGAPSQDCPDGASKKPDGTDKKKDREKRLAEALRANLRRRKSGPEEKED